MLGPLQAALARYRIESPRQVAALIGQCMVESSGFTEFEENLWWTTPQRVLEFFPSRVATLAQATQLVRNPKALACCVYAGKCGNGSVESGDGWRFRARGALGLTGHDNYRAAALGTGRPYVEQPDLVAQPADAVLSAAWFWWANGLGPLAADWRIDAITREVNGPRMADAERRLQCSNTALRALQLGATS